jgi:aspartate/methionine/tyrosine aminotransferase
MGMNLIAGLRGSARELPESGIVRVINHGRTKPGLIPLWAGEGDLPTPAFICEATAKSLAAGETFYTYQRGIPPLREALARYHQRLYARQFSPEEFFVVGGGMQAIQLAMQMTVGAGDEVLIPSPAWPNSLGAALAQGGRPVTVPMRPDPVHGWTLDLDRLFAAATPRTRAIFLNSPSNPTGWTATREELRAILDFCRARGLWIIADEIYGRFHYGDGLAPSLQDIREAGDRILFVQTFSKNWAMTGWRIGWLQAPAELGQVIENLVQYNTSGVAPFMQKGALAAIEDGEPFVKDMLARARECRDIVNAALSRVNSIRYAPPAGAFYAFFSADGIDNSLDAAIRLVDEANVGVAPGTAFGAGGEAFFRICFLRAPDQVKEAMRRITGWLESLDRS